MQYPNGNPRPGAVDRYAAGYDADGEGRDPRQMGKQSLRDLGHEGSLLKAVRANCIECCAGHLGEVAKCRMVWCPMWPYRMGTNPFHTVALSDEERARRSARLRAARPASG